MLLSVINPTLYIMNNVLFFFRAMHTFYICIMPLLTINVCIQCVFKSCKIIPPRIKTNKSILRVNVLTKATTEKSSNNAHKHTHAYNEWFEMFHTKCDGSYSLWSKLTFISGLLFLHSEQIAPLVFFLSSFTVSLIFVEMLLWITESFYKNNILCIYIFILCYS